MISVISPCKNNVVLVITYRVNSYEKNYENFVFLSLIIFKPIIVPWIVWALCNRGP